MQQDALLVLFYLGFEVAEDRGIFFSFSSAFLT